jgi:hypothetical protein
MGDLGTNVPGSSTAQAKALGWERVWQVPHTEEASVAGVWHGRSDGGEDGAKPGGFSPSLLPLKSFWREEIG